LSFHVLEYLEQLRKYVEINAVLDRKLKRFL